MSVSAPSDVVALMATKPNNRVCANLFTFTLISGPVYHFTDWRFPVTVAGVTYLPGPPRIQRGSIRTERGMVTATQQVTFQEANGAFIQQLAQGYFNRAVYQVQRVDALSGYGVSVVWSNPVVKFFGRVNHIDNITRTTAELTVKSMIDDIDKDYPLEIIEADCDRVVFDVGCGLAASAYVVSGTVAAGSTVNKMLSGLTQADVYFTQGVLIFTSGVMAGLAYMVKSYVGGVIAPAYPFLVPPVAGTTFTVTPGCDKTLATCISKYGYNPSASAAPFFRGAAFVPSPTVTY